MDNFHLFGYVANKQYSKVSKTSIFFALVKASKVFIPIIMFF